MHHTYKGHPWRMFGILRKTCETFAALFDYSVKLELRSKGHKPPINGHKKTVNTLGGGGRGSIWLWSRNQREWLARLSLRLVALGTTCQSRCLKVVLTWDVALIASPCKAKSRKDGRILISHLWFFTARELWSAWWGRTTWTGGIPQWRSVEKKKRGVKLTV